MKTYIHINISRFWFAYFLVRLFYLFFATLVYGRLTSLGDTERYLSAAINPSISILYNSTMLMDFIGGIFGKLGGASNPLSNLPFMLLSFFAIRWVIKKCSFDLYINKYLLFTLLSFPNFCIWTSVCSKETFGLVFSCILGYWIVCFLRGDFKFKKIYLLGIYLCGIFKPQYLPFILQTLLFIYLGTKIKSKNAALWLFILQLVLNITLCWLIIDVVNQYAQLMHLHFVAEDAMSTKNIEIFDQPNSFFYNAPLGMIEGFFGPTFSEMIHKPLHLLAGLESLMLILILSILLWMLINRFIFNLKFHAILLPTVFLLFTGLIFIHYPFGIFNAGSAIRYRTNFILILSLVAMEVYRQYHSYYRISMQAKD